MVVIFLPATLDMGVTQDRAASPSTCTVQAPHSALPHPNFVPVMFRVSRNTQRSGIWGLTSTVCGLPLSTKLIDMIPRYKNTAANKSSLESESGNILQQFWQCKPRREIILEALAGWGSERRLYSGWRAAPLRISAWRWDRCLGRRRGSRTRDQREGTIAILTPRA